MEKDRFVFLLTMNLRTQRCKSRSGVGRKMPRRRMETQMALVIVNALSSISQTWIGNLLLFEHTNQVEDDFEGKSLKGWKWNQRKLKKHEIICGGLKRNVSSNEFHQAQQQSHCPMQLQLWLERRNNKKDFLISKIEQVEVNLFHCFHVSLLRRLLLLLVRPYL